jgi:hypothetical protein
MLIVSFYGLRAASWQSEMKAKGLLKSGSLDRGDFQCFGATIGGVHSDPVRGRIPNFLDINLITRNDKR